MLTNYIPFLNSYIIATLMQYRAVEKIVQKIFKKNN